MEDETEEETDDRGSLRERMAALEEELAQARATLSEARAECSERGQSVAALEARLALLPPKQRARWTRTVKIVMGAFTLPVAALAGAVSGLFASLPLLFGALALAGDQGDAPATGLMLGCMALGAACAVTLAVRSLRRG